MLPNAIMYLSAIVDDVPPPSVGRVVIRHTIGGETINCIQYTNKIGVVLTAANQVKARLEKWLKKYTNIKKELESPKQYDEATTVLEWNKIYEEILSFGPEGLVEWLKWGEESNRFHKDTPLQFTNNMVQLLIASVETYDDTIKKIEESVPE